MYEVPGFDPYAVICLVAAEGGYEALTTQGLHAWKQVALKWKDSLGSVPKVGKVSRQARRGGEAEWQGGRAARRWRVGWDMAGLHTWGAKGVVDKQFGVTRKGSCSFVAIVGKVKGWGREKEGKGGSGF